jgi:hypothetical protein
MSVCLLGRACVISSEAVVGEMIVLVHSNVRVSPFAVQRQTNNINGKTVSSQIPPHSLQYCRSGLVLRSFFFDADAERPQDYIYKSRILSTYTGKLLTVKAVLLACVLTRRIMYQRENVGNGKTVTRHDTVAGLPK